MSGLTFTESLGDGWKKALHPDDRETVFENWKTSALQGASWEYRLLTPQREIRWIRALGSPIYSTQGEITGYVGTCEDITERKLADRALQERDALNRAILNSLPANIAVLNRDGSVQAANEAWTRFADAHGDPPANTGDNYLEACRRAADGGSSDAGKALAGIQDVLARKLQSFSMQYQYHSAAERTARGALTNASSLSEPHGVEHNVTDGQWFHMLVTPLAGVAGGGVVIAHADITERKRAEDAVQETLQQLHLITNNMPSGVTRCSRDLTYVWANSSYAALAGHTPEEIAGRSIVDIVGKEEYERIRPYIEKVLRGEREEFEIQVAHPGGERRWLHAVYVATRGPDHSIDGWIGVVTDLTERHEAEERLRESEERFRATFFQAAVGIAQTTTDGHWLLLNDRLCEILGYSREELLAKTVVDITHPDDREASLAAVRKLLAGEISSWATEKRYIRKDGVTVWARAFVSLVRDRQSQPLYFIRVAEDITEKIQAEHALQESRRELRALARRLINAQEEERRRISRQLHDDFSQRLALLAFDASSLALALPPSRDRIKEALNAIHSRIVQMSSDIRRISHQLHPSILEDLGLVAALREVCEEFSAREGIEATLEQETMPETLPMEVKSCLYWIAQQALHNIWKHAHATHVRISLVGSSQGVHMTILDDGVGFDVHAGHGLGLGIISMKERARMVGGELSIHSQPSQGTEVRVFIPTERADPESADGETARSFVTL